MRLQPYRRGTCAVAGGLLLLTLAASAAWAQGRQPSPVASPDLSSALAATTRSAAAAVVEIFTTVHAPGAGLVSRPSDLVATQRGSGSGVIVDPGGYIITNAHVVQDARQVRIEIPVTGGGKSILAAQSRTVKGAVIGVDLETDLAVVKIDGQTLPALPFGDSDELSAGQIVLALGSPLGFRNSVSLGVVSAVARQLEPESPMIYVQTDAAVNPGSSGGPLVDLRGRLIGINTLIVSETGGSEGLGFAAPSNIVRSVYMSRFGSSAAFAAATSAFEFKPSRRRWQVGSASPATAEPSWRMFCLGARRSRQHCTPATSC